MNAIVEGIITSRFICGRFFGAASLKVAMSYHLIARTYSCKGDFRTALQNEKEAYTIYKQVVSYTVCLFWLTNVLRRCRIIVCVFDIFCKMCEFITQHKNKTVNFNTGLQNKESLKIPIFLFIDYSAMNITCGFWLVDELYLHTVRLVGWRRDDIWNARFTTSLCMQ